MFFDAIRITGLCGDEGGDSGGVQEELSFLEIEIFVISDEAMEEYVRAAMPDAVMAVADRTGTRDHFSVRIVSAAFRGKSLLDRHRAVYEALREPMADGRIHAVEIKALTPEELSR